MNYRWLNPEDEGTITGDRDWNRIEQILKLRGWMALNRPTSRILLAEDNDELLGFMVFQLIPHVGPFWIHPAERGTNVAEEMAKQMWEFLLQAGARGWIASAESPHAARICEKYNMVRIDYPMYIVVGMEERQKESVH